ncbi:MAG: GNAT family N-acetyltransferase [Chloroflexi bacterium]|nr:GNAT family N-acetyltransferase [Chloroflexota bacterium]
MNDLRIRALDEADLPVIIDLDHSFHTDHVWQIEFKTADSEIGVTFREIHLPRSMLVEYPRDPSVIADIWPEGATLLVAEAGDHLVGYVSLFAGKAPEAVWISDLVILRRLRRQGIGTALILAAQKWALEHGLQRIVLEMQSKNFPAISLAGKLGFEFSGFNDRYYANHDIALFFTKKI